ncbi:MAG: hypothetical protein HN742_16155 [Lentisphaerae bacterium]|jgi:uncharacterized protein|nr:hypothetical protein [Lentisphaerota bacterium]MBT4820051.1 hypothetical protein [Lentisphaerota bacterium]MBT5604823.1 hypothetical protein [Lentisphaerota bacterium]MBT7053574.1 hypothetical protein [Lentisphaerota bacterium]MBT7843411.1 hypothetical protein [Lentisphaerota bacterium]
MSGNRLHGRRRLALGIAILVVSLAAFHSGCRSIHTLARQGNVRGVERRLKWGTSPDKRQLWTCEIPLISAAQGGHSDVVRLLVANGADVNLQGEAWDAALHHAAYRGHLEIVKFLVTNGADVSLFKSHDTPLHSAASGGQVEVARVLLAHGADVNWQGIDKATPLETAVFHGQLKMVEFLLANGADVNSRGLYGRTPLYVAAGKDNVTIGRVLIEHGADPELGCNDRPVWSGSAEFRALLRQSGPKR